MRKLLFAVFLLPSAFAVAKNPEPYFKSDSMPFYPPLARQADSRRSEGFFCRERRRIEQVKTWKFGWPSPCSCRVKQEAILVYTIKDVASESPAPGVTVRWYWNNRVVIETDQAPINTTQ